MSANLHPVAKVFQTQDHVERGKQLSALLSVKNAAENAYDCLYSDINDFALNEASKHLDQLEDALWLLSLKSELH